MDTSKKSIYAIIFIIVITVVSVSVAYFTFTYMSSSAEGTLKEWKLQGGFAAFILTASVLTTMFLQIYKLFTDDEVKKLTDDLARAQEEHSRKIEELFKEKEAEQKEYTKQVNELQQKIIKGAPCPDGYSVDVDEKHNLVFARPSDWVPLNGILYQYMNKTNFGNFHDNFNVTEQGQSDIDEVFKRFQLGTFDLKKNDPLDLYNKMCDLNIAMLQNFDGYKAGPTSKEYINIDGTKSLKFTHSYSFNLQENTVAEVTCSGVAVYISRLNKLYMFTFSEGSDEYLQTSEIFNNIIASVRFL